ncbi:hypothetical protein HID58_019133, partial [Brassica napus]
QAQSIFPCLRSSCITVCLLRTSSSLLSKTTRRIKHFLIQPWFDSTDDGLDVRCIYVFVSSIDCPPWMVLSGGRWPALRFWDSGNIKKNEEFMGITLLLLYARVLRIHSRAIFLFNANQTQENCGGWVWTQLGSCSEYGLYTDFEKMAGIQKKKVLIADLHTYISKASDHVSITLYSYYGKSI